MNIFSEICQHINNELVVFQSAHRGDLLKKYWVDYNQICYIYSFLSVEELQ